jgi:hypothetical protein
MRQTRMVRRLRARRPKSNSTLEESAILKGCEEFLTGQLLEEFSGRREYAPDWVWVNVLAHASEADLVSCAARGDMAKAIDRCSWEWTTSIVAKMLLNHSVQTTSSVARLQREVVIPIELGLRDRSIAPSTFVRFVQNGLEGQPGTVPNTSSSLTDRRR